MNGSLYQVLCVWLLKGSMNSITALAHEGHIFVPFGTLRRLTSRCEESWFGSAPGYCANRLPHTLGTINTAQIRGYPLLGMDRLSFIPSLMESDREI